MENVSERITGLGLSTESSSEQKNNNIPIVVANSMTVQRNENCSLLRSPYFVRSFLAQQIPSTTSFLSSDNFESLNM